MPLATLNEVMDIAKQNKAGVGMFNVVTADFAQAIVEAAEEVGQPVIVGMPERFFQYYPIEMMPDWCIRLAQRASVPVCIHLDHGKSFEMVMRTLQAGFTSVMYDGSALPYEENLANTAEIVRVAHSMGVSVEGELGYMASSDAGAADESGFTDPAQALDFAQKTGVDALAVAIGNLHGNYKGTPKLDLGRLADIAAKVDCPLVLHGGSGLSDADYLAAIKAGVVKVNIYTAMSNFMLNYLQQHLPEGQPWLDLNRAAREGLRGLVADMMRLFAGLQ